MRDFLFKRQLRIWAEGKERANGWEGIRLIHQPLFKLTVSFCSPLEETRALAEGIMLHSSPMPVQSLPVYALFLNRRSQLVISDADISEQVRDATSGDAETLVNDATHSMASILLTGDHAAELLQRGCNLDFRDDSFLQGEYARTALGQVNVILHRVAEGYLIHYPASLSQYLAEWFNTSMSTGRI